MELELLYQDDFLVAINKPSGLLVHRTNIDRHETAFAVQLLHQQLGQPVFPVHRLDKPTSGVLLFALTSEVASLLSAQWRQQQVEKRYLAIVRGWLPDFVYLDYPMAPPVDKYAKHEKVKDKQEAITDFQRLAKVELPVMVDKYPQSRYSLVECVPETGRKHQIRRHLKHLAHPIIGDARYGKGRHSRYFRDQLSAPRLLLHAHSLVLNHPVTGQPLRLIAGLDNIWRQLCTGFGWQDVVPSELLQGSSHSSLDYFLSGNNGEADED